MSTRNEVSEIRERFAEGQGESGGPRRPHSWRNPVLALVALLVVVIAIGVVFAGCGQKDDSSSTASASGTTVAPQTEGRTQVVSSAAVATPGRGGGASSAPVDSGGVQPDFEVSVVDTLVEPGQMMEFTVEGTPDLVSLTLADGRDRPVSLLREPGGNTWHAQYRVPLHPRRERFGISLTGRNASGHWRRSWVFLHVAGNDDDGPDSTEVGEG
jgi:hypothetical protein